MSLNICGHHERAISPANPHFFIPILPAFAQEQLVVPKSFLKNLLLGVKKKKMKKQQKCEELKAILRSNGRGKTWVVKLTAVNDDEKEGKVKRVWFDHQHPSWKDFSLHHGLHVGDFLVFKHIGSLSFEVIVLDSTACEKEFPTLLDHPFFDQHDNPKKETTKDLQAAGTRRCYESPSKFIATIKPSMLEPHYILGIPKGFARSNGLVKNLCVVTLRDHEDGSSWPVNLRCSMSSGQVVLSGGWAAFAKAKGLKERDVCSFELITKSSKVSETNSGITFEFTKLNSSTTWTGVNSTSLDQCQIFGNRKPDKAAAGERSSTTFVTTLKPNNLKPHYVLYIPPVFARCNGLLKKKCVVTLRDRKDGTSWPVNLRYYASQVYLTGGWAAFAKAKDLKEGNVCSFELFMESSSVSATGNNNTITFDFMVLNASTTCDWESKHLDYHRRPFFVGQGIDKRKGSKATLSRVRVVRVDVAAAAADSSFTPSCSRFVTILKHYNFSQSTLTIPVEFARANGLTEKVCMITVRDEKGKPWLMKLSYKKCSGQVYIRVGWREFCEGKGLKEGDLCSFELFKSSSSKGIKESKIVFDFCISRA